MPLLVDFEQGLQNMGEAINTAPTAEEFSKALSLALGSDTSMLYYPSAPSTGNYVTTTTTDSMSSDFVVQSEIKTIDDIVEEKIEQYKELMRLQALGCKNCGGSINKDTMTCEYCGTRYRN